MSKKILTIIGARPQFIKATVVSRVIAATKGLEEILIGREQGENIYIPEDSFVSRKHARIIFDDNNYFLEDLNSANGTCLNRSRIEKKTQISDGDIITIGHTDLKLSIGLNVKYKSRQKIS